MVRRIVHDDKKIFVCDYTQFPMHAPCAYFPKFDLESGKMSKKGNYCNWETALAAAETLCSTPGEYKKVVAHIQSQTGCNFMHLPPSYLDLVHFTNGYGLTMEAYHEACTKLTENATIQVVKITADGAINEYTMHPQNNDYPIYRSLNDGNMKCQSQSVIRGKKNGAAAKDLLIWHVPNGELPKNTVASNYFKLEIRGDLILTQKSREASFLPRERLVSYTVDEFKAQYDKKRKRSASEASAMTADEYNKLKIKMQGGLNSVEQKITKDAVTPQEHSKQVKGVKNKTGSFREMSADLARVKKTHVDPVASPVGLVAAA